MTDTPNDAKSIFLAAIERTSPAEQSAYLDEACGGNGELRRRVEELIAAHRDDSFLQQPSVEIEATLDHPSAVAEIERAIERDSPAEELGPLPEDRTRTLPSKLAECGGAVIGPYKLLQELGEGGMGTVYMADQTEPVRRKVALKIIKPGMDSRQVIARFEAERQALALMDHPNIARVLDAGTTETGRPYFVMELVKGVPITKYCDEHRLTPRERLKLVIPVCQAIQHAHQKGIIHRDIKPSNVLVTLYDGRPVPKVIDFGVAKATGHTLTERTMFTEVGQIVGTLEYMSPEQAEMNQLDIDTRSDVYALGVLLYELLTGTTPITKHQLRAAGFTEMLRTIRERQPPKPSTRLSDSGDALPSISAVRSTEPAKLSRMVRGDLDWVVMKALDKDRARRYDTASSLAEEIERYLANEPVQAGPPGSLYRMRKFANRHRQSMVTAAALLLLLVAGTVTSTWLAIFASREEHRANRAAARASQEADNAHSQEVIAQSARKRSDLLAAQERTSRVQAEQHLYFSRVSIAQNALESSDLDAARQTLVQCAPKLRDWEWYYLFAQTRRAGIAARDVDFPGAVAFAPDGDRLLSWLANTGAVTVWSVPDGKRRYTLWPKQHVDGDMNSCPPSWSPDGKLFAWSRDGATLELIDGRSGHTERSWPVKHLVANLVWKHDGTQLATLQRDQHLRVWDVDSQTMVHDAEISSNKSPWQYMGWSHDDSLFAIGAKEVVHVFDGNTWQLVDRLAAGATVPFFHWAPHRNQFLFSAEPENGETYPMISIWERGREPVPVTAWYRDAINISWSPDGKQLASIHRTEGSVSIYDATNGKMTRTLEPGRASRGRSVAWDRQGKRLATASGDGSVRIWDLDSQSNEPMAELLGHQRQVRWVGWHPNDDAMLVSFSTDKSLRFWNLEEPVVKPSQIIHAKTSIASLCWGPDGRRLAGATSQTAGQHSNVFVWNADTGKVLATPFPDAGGWSTAWNRENRLLCTQPDQWTVCIVDPDSDFDMKLEMEGDRPALPQEGVLKGAGVRWSPDGRWLAIATQREGAVVWDFARRTYVRIPSERDPDDQWATGVAWHPKGETIAVIYRGVKSDEVAVYRFDPHAITFQMVWRRRRPHIGFGHPSALAWSPDGQFLAMGDADSAIRLWDPETGDIISTHRGHTGGIHGIDWDPDGRRFASAGGEGTIRVWSRHAKQSLIVLRGHAGSVNDVKWNRDGFRLASAGSDHTVRIWDTRDAYVTWHTEKALAIFDERLATQPDDAASLKSRADILWHTGHWDQAAKDLDRWIAQRPPAESTRWYATGWWISGPYAETNLDAPEQILEMNTPPDPAGLSGETAAVQRHPWRYVAKSGLHYLDLSRDFDGDGISAFALARVYSSMQQQVRLLVRANDAVSVWLNAQRVYADPEGRLRNIVAPASEVTVTLSEGWNSLLLKVVNAPDTDGFEFALEITKP